MTTKPTGRGGPRRGQGAKPKPDELKIKTVVERIPLAIQPHVKELKKQFYDNIQR